MTANVIKLESFTALPDEPEIVVGRYFQEDLEQARAEGFAEGFAQQKDETAVTLCEALGSLGKALEINEEQREMLYKEAVSSMTPIVSEIVDALSPASTSLRLERSLTEELTRLANLAEPVCVRISCDEQLRETVEDCVAKSGISEIELEAASADGITLSHTGGNIKFSQEKITQEIRKLIDEIKEE